MIFLYIVIFCIIGYLLGSLIFGQFIAWAKNKDLTKIGSSNVGATNVRREFGSGMGLLVSVLDALKGMIAIFICWAIYGVTIFKINSSANLYPLVYLAGVFAVIGHCYPVQYLCALVKYGVDKALMWKGGKGVSTSGGVLFSVSPYLGLIAFLIWILIVLIDRRVSLGSLFCMTIATLFIFVPQIGSFYLFDHHWVYTNVNIDFDLYTKAPWLIGATFILLMFNNCLLTFKHKSNIQKIINHQESKAF